MIATRNLMVRAGTFELSNLTFTIKKGEYGVLMGKTGCGKTTILECICGLRPAVAGTIYLSGREVGHVKPAERGIGYVPQDSALFSAMTVQENLAFALVVRKWKPQAVRARVKELAKLLGIETLLARRTHGLSGGETQRVALGRALAGKPSILCLDEPVSKLDDETRDGLCDLLKRVQKHTGVTTLHVTHSLHDAEKLADSVFLIRDGRIEEISLEELKREHRVRNAVPNRKD